MTELTKLGHSCVRITGAGRTLVIDPGIFSDPASAVAGADAVLITHDHPDHVDPDVLRGFAGPVYAPASVANSVDGAITVGPGESFDAAGFPVQTVGGQHAVIHPSIPVIANVGYLIDGRIFHPGDAFTVPTAPVETLLVPIHAPWSKMAEVIDFVVAVRARHAHQIHDGLLNENGLGLVEGNVGRIAGKYGTAYEHLEVGQTVQR